MVLAILKIFTAPIIWILLLLAGGLVLTAGTRRIQKGWKKAGWYAVLAGTCILFILSFGPAANLLVYSLESGFPPVTEQQLKGLDIIVVLGGGISNSGGYRVRPEPTFATCGRVMTGVEAFKKSQAGILVLSGGGIERPDETEAAVMKKMVMDLGVSDDRILLETKSRDTRGQAREVKRLVSLGDKSRVGLVTSALHMERSLRTFKKVFPRNQIVAIPAQYLYAPFKWSYKRFIPSTEALSVSTYVIHEWIGMLWYGIRR
jgi:uncharacterized SAM-binding protein YcdF (DUF218 family)